MLLAPQNADSSFGKQRSLSELQETAKCRVIKIPRANSSKFLPEAHWRMANLGAYIINMCLRRVGWICFAYFPPTDNSFLLRGDHLEPHHRVKASATRRLNPGLLLSTNRRTKGRRFADVKCSSA